MRAMIQQWKTHLTLVATMLATLGALITNIIIPYGEDALTLMAAVSQGWEMVAAIGALLAGIFMKVGQNRTEDKMNKIAKRIKIS